MRPGPLLSLTDYELGARAGAGGLRAGRLDPAEHPDHQAARPAKEGSRTPPAAHPPQAPRHPAHEVVQLTGQREDAERPRAVYLAVPEDIEAMGVPEGLAPLNVNVPGLMSRRHC